MSNIEIESFEKCPKSTIRFVASLGKASVRKCEMAFKAEGTKCVLDTLGYFHPRFLVATFSWLEENISNVWSRDSNILIYRASPTDFERMTDFRTAPDVITVYDIPESDYHSNKIADGLILAIDGIQDPGNMGTILRTCDWFGIREVICSSTTVDVFNPKVVQSSMGAISRVHVSYCTNLAGQLKRFGESGKRIYGTFLNGENIFECDLEFSNGIIIVGNEGKGISDEVAAMVTDRLTIPSYPPGEVTSESLNVGVATAIVVSCFRRMLY